MVELRKDVAYAARDTGIPTVLKERYDNTISGLGHRMWSGITAVAASGFGKGALLVALVSILSIGLLGGFLATSAGLAAEVGIGVGIVKALTFLTSGFGLLAMGIGGTLGAVSDVKKHQGQISADVARAKAAEYEIARETARQKELQQLYSPPPAQPVSMAPAAGTPLDCGFCAMEEQRRAAAKAQGKTV